MLNVLEYPWLLLAVSLVLFMAMGTLRAVFPEKSRRWQMALPLAVAACAILLDVLFRTDREQVLHITKALHVVTQEEDLEAFAELIAPNYRDALHRDRQHLLDNIRGWLSRSQVVKARKSGMTWESLEASRARVTTLSGVVFAEDSLVAQTYKARFLIRVRLHLSKQAGGRWLIHKIELAEVDGQTFSWGQIPGSL